MTDQAGNVRNTLTDQKGVYRFANVEVGKQYTLRAAAKKYLFSPLTITVKGDLTGLDIVAAP